MFSKSDKKNNFLEQTKAARQERAQEKYREQAVILIQAYVRGFLARTRLKREVRKEFDKLFVKWKDNDSQQFLLPALEVFKLTRKFLLILNEKADQQRFERLCHHLALSMTSDNMKYCYISVAMSKEYTLLWIKQLKDILWRCCLYLRELRPECPNDSKCLAVYLHTLLTFTSISTWKILKAKSGEPLQKSMNQLCSNVMGYMNSKGFYPTIQIILNKGLARSKPCLKHASLSAITTLAIRPAIAAQFSDNIMSLFLLHILSVPAVIFHLSSSAAECLAVLMTYNIFKRSLDLLTSEQNTRIIFNSLEGNYALCLLANIIHLAALMNENLTSLILDFTNVVTRLLESCQKYVVQKKSNLTHWHPVLGWFSQTVDHRLHEAMPFVSLQLQFLWNNSMITILFDSLLTEPCSPLPSSGMTNTSPSRGSNLIRKAMEKASSRTGSIKYKKLGSSETTQVAMICALYEMALTTLTQMKLDILAGLSYQDILLPRLWKFICSVGPNNGLKAFLDHLAINPKVTCPEYQILVLFCDCTTHLVTILDDIEMYEQQKPFQLEEIVAMSNFLNQFIFKIIWNNLIDIKNINNNMLFNSTHTLLMLLYQRDCRRSYAPTDHWLIKEVKASAFLSELEKGKKAAQLLLQEVPHIIPHHERVVLFRKHVANEKTVLGLTESACASPQSTLITVHRSRIVEDGYRQLALLPSQALKGVIRVKFINEQGLDEAGIDQDGVFKEFLEETIKHVFDPSLNLFSVTTEERLYPSPSSHIHENHLALFEFVGRMLAKAVYEGIVVDVPFASFFLSQVLGHQQSALYSCIDELPSLDSDLYKSLTYIKHYEGDVRDLDLSFSCNEDYMGQLVTHELIPGGKAMPVTNENKISYVHLMAHFRMYIQIKDQTLAFIRGFRSIVNPEWLNIFSTPEVQRLISGDNTEIDLEDLRRHTQYYGGFHNNHRVVNWLWDILSKEFTPHERSLFLKFVTSCSKPPLLGFAHLEPPFSIRCVEVNDDQDTGDTLGSVLRGFFTINKKDPVNRLPTSSTCFNLLKLPNYQKKSTLRDKLRYAVSSNTGFELS